MSNPHSNEPLNNLSLRKSNDFISAKYKSSLLENQVMAIALTRIEVNSVDANAPLEARLYPGELKRLVSDPAHIYRDLSKLAKTITGHTMFIEDGKGNFKAFSVIPNAEYIDGIFVIKFNNELREHILGLEKVGRFTTFELSMMTDFKKNSSFRLYEVLKKEAYKIKTNDYQSGTQVEYNLSELRFIIGLANSDDQGVKNAMGNMGKNVDWDELYDRLDKKDKKYEEWRDFQRRVIIPAKEELEEKSDIKFEYEGLREGRKIKKILFTIYRNTPKNPSRINERAIMYEEKSKKYRQFEIPMDALVYEDLYEEFVGHNKLARQDIDLLLAVADFDKNKVKSAIAYTDSKEEVGNYMGYIISAIKGNYTSTGVVEGSAEMYDATTNIRKLANSEETARRVWEKAKNKDDFEQFIIKMQEYGLNIETLEGVYSYEELNKAYIDNKLGRKIELFD